MGENGYVVVCCQKCGWIDRSAILSVGRHGRDKKHVKNGHAVWSRADGFQQPTVKSALGRSFAKMKKRVGKSFSPTYTLHLH